MTYLLAQGGGGSGGWFSPGMIKVGIYLALGLFALLGGVFKKINEKNAQRAAEQARERRRDEMLRTGRDESGAFVDVSRVPAEALPVAVAAATSEDEAKRRLRELAERRRRELAEMMKRAAQGGAAPSQAQASGNRAGTPNPMRSGQPPRVPQQMNKPEKLQPGVRRNAEPDRKQQQRQQQQQQQQQQPKGKKGKQQQRTREQEASVSYAMPAPPSVPAKAPVHSAYHLPQHRADAAENLPGLSGKEQMSATMLRIGGGTSAGEWRRAIVLSELMQPPVSMRGE